jgi:hypothetical protein
MNAAHMDIVTTSESAIYVKDAGTELISRVAFNKTGGTKGSLIPGGQRIHGHDLSDG